MKYGLLFLMMVSALPLAAQEEQPPRHAFSIGPVVGLDFMTQEIRFGADDETRVLTEQSSTVPLFGLQAMYRIGPGLDVLTEPAFGSFLADIQLQTNTATESRNIVVEKFHVLHLPLMLRKTFSDEALTAYLIAGADMMFFLAPNARIRYFTGTDISLVETVEYEIPFSRLAVQAGIGVQWQRTETMAITADLRYRSISDDVIGGPLASIGFPAHVGLRFGLRVHLAKKKIR